MKLLEMLEDDPTYLERYVTIRDRKKLAVRRPLIEAHEHITSRYEMFERALGERQLEILQEDGNSRNISMELRACYAGKTNGVLSLKNDIRNAQPRRRMKYCPMCGITLPSTFDHYLPGVTFPEFSVHALNLVPCCALCNSIKDDDWIDARGARQYIHFYSDPMPETQFVVVHLHEDRELCAVGATFTIEPPEGVLPSVWSLITSHFTRLRLLDRYDELSNDEIGDVMASCLAHIDNGGADARGFLRSCADDYEHVYGVNHWRVTLMRAMSSHQRLEAWLENMRH